MSTIEEKILDGPTVHYCDAGDDDIRNEEIDDSEHSVSRHDASSLFVKPEEDTGTTKRVEGCSSYNTGPKGVLEDFKLTSAPKASKSGDADLDDEFNQLLNDDAIIKALAEKRLAQQALLPTFGSVFRLNSGKKLLDAIDEENKQILVIVHIYTKNSRSCSQVDRCLDELAVEFGRIKFVTIDAGVAGLSENFKQNGVPAILAYKGGNFLKSVVKLEDLLDRDFETSQLKELLIEYNLIL